MKKARKGFTLVELVIVMGIMGLLGTMGMMAGQQATDAAKASNIADNLERASSAMMSYYINNHETIDVKGAKIADVVKGANAYLKKGSLVAGTSTEAAATKGSYSVVISTEGDGTNANDTAATATWYVAYRLLDAEANGNVGAALANKATRMQLKDGVVEKAAVTADPDNGVEAQDAVEIHPYDGGEIVYMFVR